ETGTLPGLIGITYWAPKPAYDAEGRAVVPACLSAHGYGWVIDEACQNSAYTIFNPPSGGGTASYSKIIVRDPSDGSATLFDLHTHTTEFIDDPGTYVCLAQRYPVDYAPYFPQYAGTILLLPRASCDTSIPTANLAPGTPPPQATVLRDGA